MKKADKKAHRLIFRHKKKDSKVKTDKTDIILKLNQTFVKEDFSSFMWVIDAEYILSETIFMLLNKKAINSMFLSLHNDLLLMTIRHVNSEVFSVKASEQWYRLKVHEVSTQWYLTLELELARWEIETEEDLQLKRNSTWLWSTQELRKNILKNFTIIIMINFWKKAQKISADSICFRKSRYKMKFYWKLDLSTVCSRCCSIDHWSFKVCENCFSLCYICVSSHEDLDHVCKIIMCNIKSKNQCHHMSVKCENCEESHSATAWNCFKQKKIWKHHNIQKVLT